MKTHQLPNTYSTAAFFLGAIIGLVLAHSSRAAETFRLDRIAIVRFTPASDGGMDVREGILDVTGNIRWRSALSVPRIDGIPAWALDRDLARVDTWQAYHALGSAEVVANFAVLEGGARVVINDRAHIAVAVSETARVRTGDLINISTRARIAAGGDLVTAGFVIDDRPRVLLIRAVGPGLQQFDVAGPTPDPFFTVKRNGVSLHFNDNWGAGIDAALTRRATLRVGAFPLEENSRDAAKVMTLGPGAYTVEVRTASPDVPGGQVLVEVYSVPEDALDPTR